MVVTGKKPDGYEVYHSVSSTSSLTFSGGELKTKECQTDSGYGIRVLANNKIGFGYCEDRGKINRTINSASRFSVFSEKSGFAFPGKSQLPSPRSYDPLVVGLDATDLKEILDQIRDGAQRYSSLLRVNVSSEQETISLSNSSGFDSSYKCTGFSAYAEVMDGNGSGFGQYNSAFMIKDPVSIGSSAAEMAKQTRHPKKLSPGRYDVVFETEALSSVLDILLPSFSGDWERRGISNLCGKTGKRMFSRMFTLADDGTALGTGARPFDDEGVASRRRTIVDAGVFTGFGYDLENSALAKRKKSGFCNRTHYSNNPVCGFSNIVISRGDHSDLDEELGRHLLVHSVHGSHTANITTGDFGLEVNIAFLRKGKQKIPVRGFMLVGNVFDLFSNILAIEKKQQVYGSLITPRIALKGLRAVS